ncbi:hypothetical protein KI387_030341, partial [Taxus chinensis]
MRRTLTWLVRKGIDLSLQNSRVLKEFRDMNSLKEDLPPLTEGDDTMDPLNVQAPKFPNMKPTIETIDEWLIAKSKPGTSKTDLVQKEEDIILWVMQDAPITTKVSLQSKGNDVNKLRNPIVIIIGTSSTSKKMMRGDFPDTNP